MVPDFHLDDMPARLFGAERLASYDQGFDHAAAALIALEYHELGECIGTGPGSGVRGA